MKIFIALLLVSVAFPLTVSAGNLHHESWYQEQWCSSANGKTEVVLRDNTRCDCLTDTHAIEFDFAKKWAESIGQALHYGKMTGKRAGIVLILKDEAETKYVDRVRAIIETYELPIDVWKMKQ